MAAPNLTPDFTTIEAHLRHITRRWDELGQPVMMEIVALTDEDIAGFKSVAHFKIDAESIVEAAEHAAELNQYRQNVYVTVNPLDAENMPRVGKRAKAENIVASFFHWADADSEEAADNIKSTVGPKSTFVVLTGSTPFPRPHVYWELEEPTRNLEAWSQTQRNIAARLKTDKVVVDPPRIMRLAGSINWPKPQKQAKGYVPELTQLHIHDREDRPVVTSEAMARAFPDRATSPSAPQDGSLRIDTATHSGPSVEEQLDKIRRAQTDGEKHGGVRDLTASLAAQGVNRATVEAIVRAVCPVWDEGVVALIDSAFEKFWQEKKAPITDFSGAPQEHQETRLQAFQIGRFISERKPAQFVVEGMLAHNYCMSLCGFAGHGKTTLALHLAYQVAMGGFFGGRQCEQGSVLILAGENPDNVRWQAAAAEASRGLPEGDSSIPIRVLPGHFQLSQHEEELRKIVQETDNLRLIIIDSLQAFFEGENDNANPEMIDAARRFRSLTTAPGNPFVAVIAHPSGKKPDRTNIIPRGGSAFNNEMDGTLTVWAEPDGTQTLHHLDKFRGAPFEPENFVMEENTWPHIVDAKGSMVRLKFSRELLEIERMSRAEKSERRDIEALDMLSQDPKLSQRELASRLRISKSTCDRMLQKLKEDKLIRRRARKWEVTSDGEEVMNGG